MNGVCYMFTRPIKIIQKKNRIFSCRGPYSPGGGNGGSAAAVAAAAAAAAVGGEWSGEVFWNLKKWKIIKIADVLDDIHR